jgi:hypothetical protein
MAAGTAEALAEVMSGAELVTKGDLAGTETSLRAEIQAVRTELKADIAELRTELRNETASIRSAMEVLRRAMTIRLGGMIVAGFAVMSAILRMMPLHP